MIGLQSLQAARVFFARKASTERQYLGSSSQGDKREGDCPSSTNSVSGDDLEAHCVKREDTRKSALRIRLTEYACERKKSFLNWKSAQPRNIWAGIYFMVLSAVVTLYV